MAKKNIVDTVVLRPFFRKNRNLFLQPLGRSKFVEEGKRQNRNRGKKPEARIIPATILL